MSKNTKKIVGILLGIIVLVVGGVLYLQNNNAIDSTTTTTSNETVQSSINEETTTSEETSSEVVLEPIKDGFKYEGLTLKEGVEPLDNPEGTVTLRSVGDTLLHSTVSYHGNTSSHVYQDYVVGLIAEGYSAEEFNQEAEYDYTPMLAYIKPYLEYADVTVANLEVNVSSPQLEISGYPSFSTRMELADALLDSGIDIVSNATNHTIDHLSTGAHYSLENLKAAGLMSYGSFESEEDKNTPRIIEKNGISLGFLNYTYGTNGIPIPEGEEYLVNMLDIPTMVADIEELNKQVDAVVVSLHVGPEYQSVPTEEQEVAFQAAADAGAKLILGSHPHVLQPVDWLNDGETFAIYSHASFMTGQLDAITKQGGIAEVTFEKDDNGEVTVENPKFMPIYILGDYYADQMYMTVPLADYNKHQIPNGQNQFNTANETMHMLTSEFDFVTHLETDSSEEANDVFR